MLSSASAREARLWPPRRARHSRAGGQPYVYSSQTLMEREELPCHLVKLAMEAKNPYTALRDGIFTHPAMTEALNDLFATL